MSEQKSQPATESHIDWEYTCPHCSRGFDTSMANQITIVDDTEAELMCSWCKRTDTYDPPVLEEIERPPSIVDYTVVTNEQELTTARVFFEGGAWLQYRETPDGWVYEEMFNVDGEEIESFTPDFDCDDVDPATAYLQRLTLEYEKYTKRGLRIQQPHIAAVLLDGH